MPTLNEIITRLHQVTQGPATLIKTAEALNRLQIDTAGMVQLGRLREALKIRFYRDKRKQITAAQVEALHAAVDFGCAGGAFTKCFTSLRRAEVCLQVIARVLDPSLVKQGQTLLCGPASVIMSLARSKPREYVKLCAGLADVGQVQLDGTQVKARLDIRDYDGGDGLPAADWIPLASLIDQPRSQLRESTGSSAEGIFDWLKGFGFSQVVVMCNYPTEVVRCSPKNLLPESASASDKVKMTKVMCGLSQAGAPIVLLAFGELAAAIGALDQAAKMKMLLLDTVKESRSETEEESLYHAILDGDQLYFKEQKKQLDILRSSNPWVITLLLKTLTGTSAAHTLHATYVSSAKLENGKVIVSCANWGKAARGVPIPLDAFANKMVGFVSAMP